MNLKRYIDAAVRREVNKVFFKDIDASGLIRNVKRLFMMGVQHNINKWKSAPPDSINPHQKEVLIDGLKTTFNHLNKQLDDANMYLQNGSIGRAKAALDEIEYTVQGGYKNLMFKKPFSTGVKELRKLYDFLYSSRISQI